MTDTLLDTSRAKCTEPQPATAHWTAAIAQGDAVAFGAFYEAWFDRVFAMARGMSRRDEAFCLDVVQESMLKVVKSMGAMRDEAAIGAWLARAAYGATVDRLRQEQRRRRRERVVAAATPERVDSDPLQCPFHREESEWLEAAIAALPVADRELVQLRFRGGLTLSQVGEQLGITGHAAHGRIRRVLSRLKRAAQEWFDER